MKKQFFFLLLILISQTVFSQTKTAKKIVKKSSYTKQTKTLVELKVGDEYLGGTIFEIYEDGSGGKVFYSVMSDKLVAAQMYLERVEWSMASDEDLQKIFKLGLINENNCECQWNGNLWFMNRNLSYSVAYAMTAEDIMNLPDGYYDGAKRTAKIIQYGFKEDGYNGGKCKFLPISTFHGKPSAYK